jgi:hypothetical protein
VTLFVGTDQKAISFFLKLFSNVSKAFHGTQLMPLEAR